MIPQFTAKTTNLENAISLLSLMPCSMNELKSHWLFSCKYFMFSDIMCKENFYCRKWWGANAIIILLFYYTKLNHIYFLNVLLIYLDIFCIPYQIRIRISNKNNSLSIFSYVNQSTVSQIQ